jgi:hypothetical protein
LIDEPREGRAKGSGGGAPTEQFKSLRQPNAGISQLGKLMVDLGALGQLPRSDDERHVRPAASEA